MRRVLGLALAALAATLLLALTAVQAVANPPCGSTITQDTRLDADLFCPDGSGLIVEGDDVTLDLGGHVIAGNGIGAGVGAHFGTHQTIRNGTVRGFEDGVQIGPGSDPFVADIRSTGNRVFGFWAIHNNGAVFAHDVAEHNLVGFYAVTSVGEVAYATFSHDRAFWNAGLGIDTNDPNADGGHNKAKHNGDPRQCVGVRCGP
jgi:hypothetical protein